ncbi:hypothetical protein HYH03_007269 [Edaphochlamys debaryana]|uniref:DUF1279 domain-containing protein n=1 Tax=Edaphochlamys debaryana TaxID=47281 RepID=A0A836BZB4_9CHLO|nr:hypothetical protein HYH03_007269 [Edaphochlamys debaryana]|eukprot:KAG2494500.1 hypothetical protein HYH03_007269 [Edaphochlamys debaryana]
MQLSQRGAFVRRCGARSTKPFAPCRPSLHVVRSAPPTTEDPKVQQKSEAEQTALKYGLEAGLFKALTSQDEAGKPSRTEQAKQLLQQYGSAYLITSISFAIVSFTACYLAVDSGVDIASLLDKFGLQVSDTSEKVGTFALAYAAHKALSPVRFPPTVALTPVVAQFLGKKKEADSQAGSAGSSRDGQ